MVTVGQLEEQWYLKGFDSVLVDLFLRYDLVADDVVLLLLPRSAGRSDRQMI